MVDELTRYYMRKQNLKVPDEFHDEMEKTDVDELNSAVMYMSAAPAVACAIVYGYSRFRESGGMASAFAHALMKARGRFNPKNDKSDKWPSKKPRHLMTEAEKDDSPVASSIQAATVSDAYKKMKTDKEEALEERLRSSKEKAHETQQMNISRKIVRNIDPFERQRRMNSAIQMSGSTRLGSNKDDRATRKDIEETLKSPGATMERQDKLNA